MNEPNSPRVERRYGERPVVLRRGGDRLQGVMFSLYPVDCPPLVQVASVGRKWYPEVWESHGWTIERGKTDD